MKQGVVVVVVVVVVVSVRLLVVVVVVVVAIVAAAVAEVVLIEVVGQTSIVCSVGHKVVHVSSYCVCIVMILLGCSVSSHNVEDCRS